MTKMLVVEQKTDDNNNNSAFIDDTYLVGTKQDIAKRIVYNLQCIPRKNCKKIILMNKNHFREDIMYRRKWSRQLIKNVQQFVIN